MSSSIVRKMLLLTRTPKINLALISNCLKENSYLKNETNIHDPFAAGKLDGRSSIKTE